MVNEPEDSHYERLRELSHPNCVVCGDGGQGLGISFRPAGEGIVEADFACQRAFEGYPNILHGGVVCTLLDGAMTNCLFALGYAAVTADLSVRFRHPVAADGRATVRAWLESSLSPLHTVAAELLQDGTTMATAKGKFLEKL